MSDELVIIRVNVLVYYLETMPQFLCQLCCDQTDHFVLSNALEVTLAIAKLTQEGDFIDVQIGKPSALDLVFYLEEPALDVFVLVDQHGQ